ncbi:MAG: hypothetical protein ACUZ8H_01595 [Candidatus Anammoxibacter sp.]
MKTKNGKYKVEINFNDEIDFDDGKETVTVEIENNKIIKSSHKLRRLDERFIMFQTSK